MLLEYPSANSLPRRPGFALGLLLACLTLVLLGAGSASAETKRVVLYLKNGDRLAGQVLKESPESITVTTEWGAEIAVPAQAIAQREVLVNAPEAAAKKIELEKLPKSAANLIPTNSTPTDKLKGNARLGLDFLNGRRDRQLYYGRLKLEYEHPYRNSSPQQYLRTTLDYTANFGETDGIRSANSMLASVKTDFDISPHFYTYNLVSGGYDQIRKIDLGYEIGPGLGYHLVKTPTFKFDLEAGFNYEAQQRSDGDDVNDFNLRFGQRLSWKPSKRFTVTENAEIVPRVINPRIFAAKFDANLAYALTEQLSLNLSVLDLYDAAPANDVNNNEIQLRSSLGVTF